MGPEYRRLFAGAIVAVQGTRAGRRPTHRRATRVYQDSVAESIEGVKDAVLLIDLLVVCHSVVSRASC